MDWIVLVRLIHDTGSEYSSFREGKILENLKKKWILEDFATWSYFVYLLLY
jgi:hypothetical protein